MPFLLRRLCHAVVATVAVIIAVLVSAGLGVLVGLAAYTNGVPLWLAIGLGLVCGGFIVFPGLASTLLWAIGPAPRRPRYTFADRRRRRILLRQWRKARRHQRSAQSLARLTRRVAETRAAAVFATAGAPARLDRLTDDDLATWQRQLIAIPPAARASRLAGYHDALDRMATPIGLAVDPQSFTSAARRLFLSALISGVDGRRPDRLDLVQSTFTSPQRLVFVSAARAIDLASWQRALPEIDALLAATHRVMPGDGLSLTLEQLPDLPDSFPLRRDDLRSGALYLGRDLVSGQPFHLPFADLTHTLICGPSGMGKSTLAHALICQLAWQQETVTEAVLVDLKDGLELAIYTGRAPNLTIIDSVAGVSAVLVRITDLMRTRLASLKATGRTTWSGPPVLVLIDEFAAIASDPAGKDLHAALVRLGNQSRAAGIHLIIGVQHAVAETVPTALRRNLATTISFRQPSGQAAAQVFGDTHDLPVDITRLKRGQFVCRLGRTAETIAVQAPYVTGPDALAFLPQSHDERSP